MPVQPCALCIAQAAEPGLVKNPVGLLTRRTDLLRHAVQVFGELDGATHALIPVCPEHVVEVYRGRVAGVRMAWRLGPPSDRPAGAATPAPQGHAAESASRA